MRYRLAKAIAEMTDSPLKTGVASAVIGAGAAVVEYGAHTIAMRTGFSDAAHIEIDAAIIGVATALLMWFLFSATQARRRRVLEHLRNVAELNHQVRNALQVIVSSHHNADPEHAALVMDSVQRIDRTLRELFPIIGDRAEDVGVEVEQVLREVKQERRKAQ